MDNGKLKIVILGTAYPYRGGLAAFNERLARQFAAEGHEVRVETFTLQYPAILFPGKTQYSTEQAPDGLAINRSLNSCNPLSWIRLGRKLKKEAPDLLVCAYWMAFMAPAFGTVCKIAKKNGKTRCVALVHNMFPHEKGALDKLFAPWFTGSQDGFVALSDSVVHDIGTLAPETPKTFSPHPVYDHYGSILPKDEACRILGLDASKHYILFFGLVRAYKGLDLLIDALAIAKKRLTDVRLVIAGEFYEDEDKYLAQIAERGVEDIVVVRNEFVPDALLPALFGAADLIAQPYKSATQSGVTQVAFHFEKPMLVTNVGGLGEIVHHGKMGYAVEPKAEAIAEALTDYFTNKRQQPFTEYLRKEKTKYSWDKITKKFYELSKH